MCSITDYPYTIGNTSADYFMSPIRDATNCASILPAKSHIMPIMNKTAYIDLWVVEVQFIVLALLLLVIPVISYRFKKYGLTIRLVSYVFGLACAELILFASINHNGSDIVTLWLLGVAFLLAAPAFIYSLKRHRKQLKKILF